MSYGQDEMSSSLDEHKQQIMEHLVESRDECQKDLHDREARIIHAVEGNARLQSSTLAALYQAQEFEIKFLQSLHFPLIDDRYESIPEAHCQTFSWIFIESEQKDGFSSNFVKWLREGRGIYWVNGKAGSGKSTLMRYIFNDERTRIHLNHWAEGVSLEVAGFFFWNSGSLIQRSQRGLFQSLLFQILQRRPNLVRVAFPEAWARNSVSEIASTTVAWQHHSLSSLKAAFKRCLTQFRTTAKICFFIDGLDEYDGDHEEIATLFNDVSWETCNIKLCVSSRPWLVFDEAFRGSPLLLLQDLTYNDIEAYVSDKLDSHERMRSLKAAEPVKCCRVSGRGGKKSGRCFPMGDPRR